jgi:hypothetical protein
MRCLERIDHSADPPTTMSSDATSDRKRKPTAAAPEAVVSIDDQNKSKARRVSAAASASPNVNLMAETVTASDSEQDESVSDATQEDESMESTGQMIQDLFHSDNVKVIAALDALELDLDKDKKKCEKIQAVGGCFALVHLMKNCLDKAIDGIPACDQVTELNELAELTTLFKTLPVIVGLTYCLDKSHVGISSVGGVEAIVKLMKTFPKCQALQLRACCALGNLTCFNLGKKKAVASGGLQVLLAAVNNHLDSAKVCEFACWALSNIVDESKENTKLLISLGGATAVAKVREECPDDNDVQTEVRSLAKSIGTEMKSWADEE